MIKIDIMYAIAGYLSTLLGLVFIIWLTYNETDAKLLDTTDDLQRCPYCTYIFFRYREAEIIKCPQCKSYVGSEPLIPEHYPRVKKATDQ